MYHALLTNRYLTSRVIPLIAVAAVALCVALVIIVVSVMTGFLDMVRSSGRTLMGDVIVTYPVDGIPHYERLIEHIAELEQAEAAAPVVEGWGLVRMPYPIDSDRKATKTVQVWGIDGRFADVTSLAETIYWRPYTPDELERMEPDDPRRAINERRPDEPMTVAQHLFEDALSGRQKRTGGTPGMLTGIHVAETNVRQNDGSIRPMLGDVYWMPYHEIGLTMIPLDSAGGTLQPESYRFPVINEFRSGVFLIDEKRVMIPLDIGQDLLHLDEGQATHPTELDEETGLPKVIGVDPARVTMVLVRAADGYTPQALRDAVKAAYHAFHLELLDDETAVVKPPARAYVSVHTWEEQQAKFLGPIEKERELMRTLFSLVYLVCAGLVLAIFWAIVYEKTRDIGILRSVGASRLGISWIFLRYGLVIGVAGAIVGLGLAYLITHNINTIHDAMGNPPVWLAIALMLGGGLTIALALYKGRYGDLLPLTLGALVAITLIGVGSLVFYLHKVGGFQVWTPEVYYFTEIPNRMDGKNAVVTMIGAVVFSLIGAFLPAAKAADTDPVRALRYE